MSNSAPGRLHAIDEHVRSSTQNVISTQQGAPGVPGDVHRGEGVRVGGSGRRGQHPPPERRRRAVSMNSTRILKSVATPHPSRSTSQVSSRPRRRRSAPSATATTSPSATTTRRRRRRRRRRPLPRLLARRRSVKRLCKKSPESRPRGPPRRRRDLRASAVGGNVERSDLIHRRGAGQCVIRTGTTDISKS